MILNVTEMEFSVIGIALATLVNGERPPVDDEELEYMRSVAYDLHQKWAPIADKTRGDATL